MSLSRGVSWALVEVAASPHGMPAAGRRLRDSMWSIAAGLCFVWCFPRSSALPPVLGFGDATGWQGTERVLVLARFFAPIALALRLLSRPRHFDAPTMYGEWILRLKAAHRPAIRAYSDFPPAARHEPSVRTVGDTSRIPEPDITWRNLGMQPSEGRACRVQKERANSSRRHSSPQSLSHPDSSHVLGMATYPQRLVSGACVSQLPIDSPPAHVPKLLSLHAL
jgi:hypothetical protein